MDTAESMSDIQNYLDNFQKDLQTGSNDQGGIGEVYMDQSGQYFIRSATEQPAEVAANVRPKRGRAAAAAPAPAPTISSDHTTTTTVTTADGQQLQLASSANTAAAAAAAAGNYQTVTIVPTENSDEVSYVLIVQPDAEEGQKVEVDGQNMAVYDFNEADEQRAEADEPEDDKRRVPTRSSSKKSQSVSQAFMCNYCNYTSQKRYLLSRHMKSHSEERPHKCSVCERGFKTMPSLQNHMNIHTGTKPHCCRFCDSNFTTSGELVRHVRYIHTKEKPHQCTECDYCSVELSKLRRHMRSHTGERPYQCPHCTYASPDTFKLKRHLRIHTGEKPYECDICGSRFTQSNSLKAHKMIHSGAKPIYQCELCPTTCGRKTDLRIHVQKLHTSDKPIKCKRCGETFPDRYSYKLHSKTHEGEKCFKCDLCPYSTINQRHLESHMLVHTDQKPYVCQHCDQSFRQKQLLKRHVNLYHNPHYIPPPPREKTHECPECGRSFRHKGNLIRHLAIHDPDASAAEKQMALKLGRERKIALYDGADADDADMYGSEDEEMEEIGEQQTIQQVGDDVIQQITPDDPLADGQQRMVAVQGEDGQQYVVLEVIQLQDANGEAQTVAVVPDSALEQSSTVALDAPLTGSGVTLSTSTDASIHQLTVPPVAEQVAPTATSSSTSMSTRSRRSAAATAALKTRDDMQNCFGFDEDDETDTFIDGVAKQQNEVPLF